MRRINVAGVTGPLRREALFGFNTRGRGRREDRIVLLVGGVSIAHFSLPRKGRVFRVVSCFSGGVVREL